MKNILAHKIIIRALSICFAGWLITWAHITPASGFESSNLIVTAVSQGGLYDTAEAHLGPCLWPYDLGKGELRAEGIATNIGSSGISWRGFTGLCVELAACPVVSFTNFDTWYDARRWNDLSDWLQNCPTNSVIALVVADTAIRAGQDLSDPFFARGLNSLERLGGARLVRQIQFRWSYLLIVSRGKLLAEALSPGLVISSTVQVALGGANSGTTNSVGAPLSTLVLPNPLSYCAYPTLKINNIPNRQYLVEVAPGDLNNWRFLVAGYSSSGEVTLSDMSVLWEPSSTRFYRIQLLSADNGQ